ncbi:MAG: hypothetical protein NC341_12495 [Blautia sp.]|nr:hypothetical protein [Blautia sp.]
MKYGVHASESVDDIVARKMKEVEQCGKMFWGYGGVVCHPSTQVQPFISNNILNGEKTYLLLAATPSKLFNEPVIMTEYSLDRKIWNKMPAGIKVSGSKYAIVCKSLEHCELEINLDDYVVPLGDSKGVPVSEYMRGRVDKACGLLSLNHEGTHSLLKVSLCAEIDYPGAVFCR